MSEQTRWPQQQPSQTPRAPWRWIRNQKRCTFYTGRRGWNGARVREDLVQRAAKRCVTRILRPKARSAGGRKWRPRLLCFLSRQLGCSDRIRAGARWAKFWGRCASPRLRNRCSSPLRARFQVKQCSKSGA
jgi:hypothetical protein